MLSRIQLHLPSLYSAFIGGFFLFVLHFKWSYSLFPILLAVAGIVIAVKAYKAKKCNVDNGSKWLIGAFSAYFLVVALLIFWHKDKANVLDIPSRLVLMLPLLALLAQGVIKQFWVLNAILAGSLLAGLIGAIEVFGFGLKEAFPQHMRIQSGDIAMTLSLFCFGALFYFKANGQRILAIVALLGALSALVGSVLTGARGAWLALPLLALLLWFYRSVFSKWIMLGIGLVMLAGGVIGGDVIGQRYAQAEQDIQQYIEKDNGRTSLGARFHMWKSAWRGIQEKPLLGWGAQGVKEMRKQHEQEKYISKYAGRFDHAHNQYLHDSSVNGVLGLLALLGIFLAPLIQFARQLKHFVPNSLGYLWGVLGITHILATMLYCLSQAFLSHNSGIMFYGFVTVLLFGLQKSAQKSPLA